MKIFFSGCSSSTISRAEKRCIIAAGQVLLMVSAITWSACRKYSAHSSGLGQALVLAPL